MTASNQAGFFGDSKLIAEFFETNYQNFLSGDTHIGMQFVEEFKKGTKRKKLKLIM